MDSVANISQLEKDVAAILTKTYEREDLPFEHKANLYRISKEHSRNIRNRVVKTMHEGIEGRKAEFEHYTEICFVAKSIAKNANRKDLIFNSIVNQYGKRISEARNEGMDGFGISLIPLHSKSEERNNTVIVVMTIATMPNQIQVQNITNEFYEIKKDPSPVTETSKYTEFINRYRDAIQFNQFESIGQISENDSPLPVHLISDPLTYYNQKAGMLFLYLVQKDEFLECIHNDFNQIFVDAQDTTDSTLTINFSFLDQTEQITKYSVFVNKSEGDHAPKLLQNDQPKDVIERSFELPDDYDLQLEKRKLEEEARIAEEQRKAEEARKAKEKKLRAFKKAYRQAYMKKYEEKKDELTKRKKEEAIESFKARYRTQVLKLKQVKSEHQKAIDAYQAQQESEEKGRFQASLHNLVETMTASGIVDFSDVDTSDATAIVNFLNSKLEAYKADLPLEGPVKEASDEVSRLTSELADEKNKLKDLENQYRDTKKPVEDLRQRIEEHEQIMKDHKKISDHFYAQGKMLVEIVRITYATVQKIRIEKEVQLDGRLSMLENFEDQFYNQIFNRNFSAMIDRLIKVIPQTIAEIENEDE